MINRISNKINRIQTDLLFSLNFEKFIFSKKRGAVILCYHGLDLYEDKRFNMRFFSNKTIEKHFFYLKKYTNVISVKDYFEGRFDSTKLNVAITFDDGYKNNFKYLKPLLEQYEIHASIYVTGLNQTNYPFIWADFADLVLFHTKIGSFYIQQDEFIKNLNGQFVNQEGLTLKHKIKEVGGWEYKEDFFKLFESEFNELKKNKALDDYWKIMSDEEIKACQNSRFITIGSHGYYHNNLNNIPFEDAKGELVKSKLYLENLTQTNVSEIAYPDGAYTEELSKWANDQMNLKYQLACSFKFEDDHDKVYIRSRFDLYPVFSYSNQLKEIQPILKF